MPPSSQLWLLQRSVLGRVHPRIFDHKWTPLSSETYIIDTGGVYGMGIGKGVCGGVQVWLVSQLVVKDSHSFALATSMRVQRDGFHDWCIAIYCRNKCYRGQLYRLYTGIALVYIGA